MDYQKYSVILNVLPDSPFSEFLEGFCSRIIQDDESHLLHLWCSLIDKSHPVYVEAVIHKLENASTQHWSCHRLCIPHSLVLMISEPGLDDAVVGFQT